MHAPPLPPGPFDLILADPGWKFETWSAKGRKKCPKYRTESVEEICALPVRQIAAKRCRLLLWVPNTHLDRGGEVIRAWGFGYKGNWLWIKEGAPATGWWARYQHEVLLIGARGNRACPQDPALRPCSWFAAPVPRPREHSRKPPELYDRIAVVWPESRDWRKVELYARPPHQPGWTVWGDEA